jgi:dihydropteroate synthase
MTMKWRCSDHTFDFSKQGEIMGILNVTPDSFSDGGRYDSVASAVDQAQTLIKESAAIIDIGGESTRPGAPEVSAEEECRRVIPVIEALTLSNPEVVISIDTSKPEVAEKAIAAGAKIINDVTGCRDPEMISLAARTGAGLVGMHMQGTPRTMQSAPVYEDVVSEIRDFFAKRHASFLEAGVDPETIVYDPGIGFGKTQEHNLTLLKHLDQLVIEGRPLLLGVSRKSFIGKAIGSDEIGDRDWPTVAITSLATELGVPLHRVHDVKPNYEALRMTESILPK